MSTPDSGPNRKDGRRVGKLSINRQTRSPIQKARKSTTSRSTMTSPFSEHSTPVSLLPSTSVLSNSSMINPGIASSSSCFVRPQLGVKRRSNNSNDDECSIEMRRRRIMDTFAFEEIVRLAHSAVTPMTPPIGPLSPLTAAQAFALEQIHLRVSPDAAPFGAASGFASAQQGASTSAVGQQREGSREVVGQMPGPLHNGAPRARR